MVKKLFLFAVEFMHQLNVLCGIFNVEKSSQYTVLTKKIGFTIAYALWLQF